jgi:hypothetical protein
MAREKNLTADKNRDKKGCTQMLSDHDSVERNPDGTGYILTFPIR